MHRRILNIKRNRKGRNKQKELKINIRKQNLTLSNFNFIYKFKYCNYNEILLNNIKLQNIKNELHEQ